MSARLGRSAGLGGSAGRGPRYVSLCPSLTESLFDLGVGPQVVGATKFCVSPAAGMEHVERVGGTKDPRIDRILALDPSLVFMNEEENRLEDAEALAEAGIDVHTSFPRSVRDVIPLIQELGNRVDRATEAAAQARHLADTIEELTASGRALSPLSFVALIWRKPWMAATKGTFLSDVVETLGGRNQLDGADGHYPVVEVGDIAGAAPDLVLLPDEPFPFREEHVDELVRGTRIGRSRFLLCPGQLLTWHGTRTASSLRAVQALISDAVGNGTRG